MCLLISDHWVTPSSNIFLICSFTRLSTRVGRFPLYRSVKDSRLCVDTGCELETHSLGCGQHCSRVCVGLVRLRGVYPSSVPLPEVLCYQRVACTPSIPLVFLEMLELEMFFFPLIMACYPNLFTSLFVFWSPTTISLFCVILILH